MDIYCHEGMSSLNYKQAPATGLTKWNAVRLLTLHVTVQIITSGDEQELQNPEDR